MQKHLGAWPDILQRDEKKPIVYTLTYALSLSRGATRGSYNINGSTFSDAEGTQVVTCAVTVGGGTQTSLSVTMTIDFGSLTTPTPTENNYNGWTCSGWSAVGGETGTMVATFTKASLAVGTENISFNVYASGNSTYRGTVTCTSSAGSSAQVGSATLTGSPASWYNYIWLIDPGSSKHTPHTGTEWSDFLTYMVSYGGYPALTAGAPNHLWSFQNASGGSDDQVGSATLTDFVGGWSYQQTFSGWTRYVMICSAGGGALLGNTSVGNAGANSQLMIGYVAVTATPTVDRNILGVGSGGDHRCANVTNNPYLQAYSNEGGGHTNNGSSTVGTTIKPVVVRVDRASISPSTNFKVYSADEMISGNTTTSSTGGNLISIGAATAQTCAAAYTWCAHWEGTGAEITETQIRYLLQALGWTVSW